MILIIAWIRSQLPSKNMTPLRGGNCRHVEQKCNIKLLTFATCFSWLSKNGISILFFCFDFFANSTSFLAIIFLKLSYQNVILGDASWPTTYYRRNHGNKLNCFFPRRYGPSRKSKLISEPKITKGYTLVNGIIDEYLRYKWYSLFELVTSLCIDIVRIDQTEENLSVFGTPLASKRKQPWSKKMADASSDITFFA